MNCKELYDIYTRFPQISTDSRNVLKNSIFFALKGANFDGNKYASKALESGCAYAVVDDPGYAQDSRYILVDDVLKSLQELAQYHRRQLNIPIIGITGTNGKTTTKELITAVLGRKFKVVSTKGNFNNHIGVPLTLLSIDKDTEIAIVEMGANHPGEIADLCQISQPNYGLITNIGKAHLEGFGSLEGVIQTKKALYDYIQKNKGTIFVNADNPMLRNIVPAHCNSIMYGVSAEAITRGEFVGSNPFLELIVYYQSFQPTKETNSKIHTQLVGSYNFDNAMAAACVGIYFGVQRDEIKKALEEYQPDNSRSQLVKTGHNQLLLDLYNANPSSMEAALKNFALMAAENKTVILGDMLELGPTSEEEHKKILTLAEESGIKQAFFVGTVFCKVLAGGKYPAFESVEEFNEYLKLHPIQSSLILIKGSHGIHLEKTAQYL